MNAIWLRCCRQPMVGHSPRSKLQLKLEKRPSGLCRCSLLHVRGTRMQKYLFGRLVMYRRRWLRDGHPHFALRKLQPAARLGRESCNHGRSCVINAWDGPGWLLVLFDSGLWRLQSAAVIIAIMIIRLVSSGPGAAALVGRESLMVVCEC